MSSGIAEDRTTGLERILAEAEQIAPPENTIPSQGELAAQARLSPKLHAGHRQGKCYVEARVVEDGIAYRLPDTEDWQWMRDADFRRYFLLWEPVSTAQILALESKLASSQESLEIALNAMGKKTHSRYVRRMRALIDDKTRRLRQTGDNDD